MIRADGEVTIAAPAEAVFALLADPTRIPAWRPEILTATQLAGQGVGARYAETMQFFGRKRQTFEIVEYEPARRLTVRAIDGLSLRPTQRYELTPSASGTIVRYAIELPLRGGFVLMRPMLAAMIPKKWRQYALALKQLSERP
jgi:uncharacterized protein YndB with AHSA1/START domain